MDGHQTHCDSDFMATCYQNQIIAFYSPAHASHVLQPLDVAVFSPLKTYYKSEVTTLARAKSLSKINRHDFLLSYQKARPLGLSEKNIRAGFRHSGLWPINPTQVLGSNWVTEAPEPAIPKPLKSPLDPAREKEGSPQYIRALKQQHKRELASVEATLARHIKEVTRLKSQLADASKKKKRSSVKKSPNELFVNICNIQDAQAATKASGKNLKRKRGRPRKEVLKESSIEGSVEDLINENEDLEKGQGELGDPVVKRRRGRPRKAKSHI